MTGPPPLGGAQPQPVPGGTKGRPPGRPGQNRTPRPVPYPAAGRAAQGRRKFFGEPVKNPLRAAAFYGTVTFVPRQQPRGTQQNMDQACEWMRAGPGRELGADRTLEKLRAARSVSAEGAKPRCCGRISQAKGRRRVFLTARRASGRVRRPGPDQAAGRGKAADFLRTELLRGFCPLCFVHTIPNKGIRERRSCWKSSRLSTTF